MDNFNVSLYMMERGGNIAAFVATIEFVKRPLVRILFAPPFNSILPIVINIVKDLGIFPPHILHCKISALPARACVRGPVSVYAILWFVTFSLNFL